MEADITKQDINSINISFYGSNALTETAVATARRIFCDTDTPGEFNFYTCTTGINADEADKNDLAIIVRDSRTKESAAGLIAVINKINTPYVTVDIKAGQAEVIIKKLLSDLNKALNLGFNITDFVYIFNKGICINRITSQLLTFKNGIPKINLHRPATIHDGIFGITPDEAADYATLFDNRKNNYKLTNFVPASGAASRMFKFLYDFVNDYNPDKESINAYINHTGDKSLSIFLVGLDKFPFFNDVYQVAKQHPDYPKWNKDRKFHHYIKTMLIDRHFDFANKPKGVLPFHKYDSFNATPVYEHLKEGIAYAESGNEACLHFTISEEHLDDFKTCIEKAKNIIGRESDVAINIDFSYQHVSTDTIAVTPDDKPFRDKGKLLFRPGGHGALIENLNAIDADIVFVKNIDNVSHTNIESIVLYKKALAGILMKLQEKVFELLHSLDNSSANLNDIFTFVHNRLGIDVARDINKYTQEYKEEYARELLNRPIRVCGMVKNEGEPGGGPFWVKGDKGRLSLQIVESSQVDMDSKQQKKIFSKSTHFNPVDLVCGLKNYKGESFDLTKCVDHTTGFIVHKNKSGKDLKGYELPGLWNGAMAGWITIFAEVPLDTFNPVKTVNDLLKPAHQPQNFG